MLLREHVSKKVVDCFALGDLIDKGIHVVLGRLFLHLVFKIAQSCIFLAHRCVIEHLDFCVIDEVII